MYFTIMASDKPFTPALIQDGKLTPAPCFHLLEQDLPEEVRGRAQAVYNTVKTQVKAELDNGISPQGHIFVVGADNNSVHSINRKGLDDNSGIQDPSQIMETRKAERLERVREFIKTHGWFPTALDYVDKGWVDEETAGQCDCKSGGECVMVNSTHTCSRQCYAIQLRDRIFLEREGYRDQEVPSDPTDP